MSSSNKDELSPADRPLGDGERGWHPYALRSEVTDMARRLANPLAAYRELLASEGDPYWREVLLFLTASSEDPRADVLLLDALKDPQLRPRALYLLGVAGTKGWPRRERDTAQILRAIVPHVDDSTPYEDVVHGTTVENGDFARAAFVRIAGPDRFPSLANLPWTQADFIGLTVPELSPETRATLSAEIRGYAESL
jgi:hypothetical protein